MNCRLLAVLRPSRVKRLAYPPKVLNPPGKLVWKDTSHPAWEKATVPGEFVYAEFLFKDSEQYKDTGGWGFARWKGLKQTPYGKDASFVQECYSCHTPVKDNDYVFTHTSSMP